MVVRFRNNFCFKVLWRNLNQRAKSVDVDNLNFRTQK